MVSCFHLLPIWQGLMGSTEKLLYTFFVDVAQTMALYSLSCLLVLFQDVTKLKNYPVQTKLWLKLHGLAWFFERVTNLEKNPIFSCDSDSVVTPGCFPGFFSKMLKTYSEYEFSAETWTGNVRQDRSCLPKNVSKASCGGCEWNSMVSPEASCSPPPATTRWPKSPSQKSNF